MPARFTHQLFNAVVVAFALSICHSTNAQTTLSEWHFGGTGINFSGGALTDVTSNSNAANDRGPSCISDNAGNLLFYADEQNVYNSNNDIMGNGVFSSNCLESIIVPHPENTDQYYLVRSLGIIGLEHSLIDMTLDGGLGDIVEGQKEVYFFTAGGRLMVAEKNGGDGHWLICANNGNGMNQCYIRTFNVGDTGISLHNEFTTTWTWIGWYPELDDARISPDCNTIAVAFKGHYIGLMSYDTEEGNVIEALSNSLDNSSGISKTRLCFSPNSEILYSVGDGDEITRFDVTSFDSNVISSTLATVIYNPFEGNYTDLQLASNGKIYALNIENQALDVINAPDMPTDEVDFEENVWSLNSNVHNRLPSRPNLSCFSSFAVNPQAIDVCLGEETTFFLNATSLPDEVNWDFGDGNTSEEVNPTHTYSDVGTYEVTVETTFGEETVLNEVDVNVDVYPVLELEPEFTLCEGEALLLTAADAETYLWSTGETTQSIEVISGGLFSVSAGNGVCFAEAETEVIFIAMPVFSIEADETICDETSTVLTASQPVEWSTGDFSEQITVTESAIYSASLSNECFNEEQSVAVNFVTTPNLNLPEALTICSGDSVIIASSVPLENAVWSTDFQTTEGDSIEVYESGTYALSGLYMGCPVSDATEVELVEFLDVNQLLIPNVFTPNDDAVNGVFRPFQPWNPSADICALSYVDVDLSVYNRWGNLITENACDWKGRTEGGNDVEEGVYYYIIEMASTCTGRDSFRRESGHLTLKR